MINQIKAFKKSIQLKQNVKSFFSPIILDYLVSGFIKRGRKATGFKFVYLALIKLKYILYKKPFTIWKFGVNYFSSRSVFFRRLQKIKTSSIYFFPFYKQKSTSSKRIYTHVGIKRSSFLLPGSNNKFFSLVNYNAPYSKGFKIYKSYVLDDLSVKQFTHLNKITVESPKFNNTNYSIFYKNNLFISSSFTTFNQSTYILSWLNQSNAYINFKFKQYFKNNIMSNVNLYNSNKLDSSFYRSIFLQDKQIVSNLCSSGILYFICNTRQERKNKVSNFKQYAVLNNYLINNKNLEKQDSFVQSWSLNDYASKSLQPDNIFKQKNFARVPGSIVYLMKMYYNSTLLYMLNDLEDFFFPFDQKIILNKRKFRDKGKLKYISRIKNIDKDSANLANNKKTGVKRENFLIDKDSICSTDTTRLTVKNFSNLFYSEKWNNWKRSASLDLISIILNDITGMDLPDKGNRKPDSVSKIIITSFLNLISKNHSVYKTIIQNRNEYTKTPITIKSADLFKSYIW